MLSFSPALLEAVGAAGWACAGEGEGALELEGVSDGGGWSLGPPGGSEAGQRGCWRPVAMGKRQAERAVGQRVAQRSLLRPAVHSCCHSVAAVRCIELSLRQCNFPELSAVQQRCQPLPTAGLTVPNSWRAS